jgi:antitoxin component of MazEF toxin-antitoxin module
MQSKMIHGKVRKWGNSMGMLLSKKDLSDLSIRENDEVDVIIAKKSNVLMDMAGKLPFKKPTAQLLREARKNSSKWGLD